MLSRKALHCKTTALRAAFAAAAICMTTAPLLADVAMPRIMSHRGESNDRPENTMAAFRLAFERGVDGVECDVYATTDNVPVIIHDSTTGRTAGSGTNLTVTASSWNDLKDVRVGAFGSWIGTEWEGETLPKLEDYLALLSMNSTTRCIIELKGNGANNLVSNVVEAVRAQPLATSNRVVFISFDFSLISAIRTALPDYEAWLLYSSGTYTGAGLISAIQNNNATGVDILHTATFSAEDVAAVKAAGYAFAVWTCDNDNTALTLAQKGVDEITTNRGGAMKTALAALIADANNPEINESGFPSGATAMEPSAYVQTGLVGHFDGIRNAGMNLPHDPSTRTWKNLVSGYPDAPFTGNGGYWTSDGKGFYFDGSSVYARLASPGIDLHHETSTIQLVMDTPTSQQPLASGYYPGIFYSSDDDDFGFFLNNSGGKTRDSTLHWKVKAYRTDNRPEIANWGGKYVTGLFTKSNQYLFEGTQLANAQSCSARTDKTAKQWSWGGSARETAKRYAKGTYYSVRIYNSTLTANNLVWNRLVDEVRFRGLVTNGTVVVATSIPGAEGKEASGTYYVNGHHTFTASAATADGRKYKATGYTLEIYNPSTGEWVSDGEGTHAGRTFSYTNRLASTGARITWQWTDAWPVGAMLATELPTAAYVTDCLVGHFDGIRNAGADQPHNSSATTWKNLGSGGSANDATLTTLSADVPSGAENGVWTDTGHYFKGKQYFDIGGTITLGKAATVQLATEWTTSIGDVSGGKWPLMFGGTSADADNFCIWHDKNVFSPTYLKILGNRISTSNWDGYSLNAIFDGANSRGSVSKNTAYSWQSGMQNKAISSANTKYAIGTAGLNTSYKGPRMFKGIVKAVRIYDRILAEAELAWNQDLDEIRLRGLVKSGTVVVATSVSGAEGNQASGQYYVNGHATFTAPATATVNGLQYSLLGCAVEHYNPTTKVWEYAGVSEGGSFTYTNSTANTGVRITWQWNAVPTSSVTVPTGATLASKLYVTDHLISHFDGIRNAGFDQSHDSATRTWKNLVSGGPDAQFYFNNAVTANGNWTDNGFYFNNSVCARLVSNLSLGTYPTLEFVTTINLNEQTYGTNKNFFKVLFHQGTTGDNPSLFINNNGGSRTSTVYLKADNYADSNNSTSPRPSLANWQGKYLTFILGNGKNYMTQTTALGSGSNRNKTSAINSMQFSWGGVPYNDNNSQNRNVKGTYHAVRIYSDNLTENELAWNRYLDELRFRGADVTREFVVVKSGVEGTGAVEGVEGTEISGTYYVNGSHTFTAPATTNVNGIAYTLRGYTLEIYNPWTKNWESDGVELHETTSFAYTNCLANTGARITWQWVNDGVPYTATYTGLGTDPHDLTDGANWACTNAYGTALPGAVPDAVLTAVTVAGETAFQVASGVAFACGSIKFDNATFADGADLRGLDWSKVTDDSVIDLQGRTLFIAGTSVGTLTITDTSSGNPGELHWSIASGTFNNSKTALEGNLKFVKEGSGTFVSARAQTYSGVTLVAEGTAQPPDGNGTNTNYSYDSFKAFSTNEIVVASGATFDLRANYAYRSHVVLAGGTFTNTKADMTKTTWGGSGIGRLEADSTNRVPYSIVFGDSNGNGNMDLNGHTLTVLVGSAKRFYLRCAKIENGKIDFAAGDGWFQVCDACVATNVDFRINSALSVGAALSVRDYEAIWTSNSTEHNQGTAALNIYGTFTPNPNHQRFYGCTMQDGSTIDLSGRTGAFSTLSTFTTGSTNLHFAANANITIKLAGRTDLTTILKSDNPFVMTWPEGLGPAANVTFKVDAATKAAWFKVIRDDENNGLRLVRRRGIMIIAR